MEKAKLIYNPVAGKGKAAKELELVLSLLEERGFEFDLMLTEKVGDAIEFSRQAAEAGAPLVIGAGGDGTLSEVINGIMRANMDGRPRPVLGVLPVGRGNDFSYGMDVPQDLTEAIDVLVQGKTRMIDVGYLVGGNFPDGRYFGNGLGLGFDTVVGFEANKISWLHGGAAYLAGLVRTIFKYAKAPVYEIEVDGKSRTEAFLMVSIMNGRRMGGAFYMAPDGDPGDGLFNLCLVNQVPQLKILPLATKFFSGSQGSHPAVSMEQAKSIRIKAITGSIPAHADGETVCTEGVLLSAQIEPNAILVISQKDGKAG